MSRCRAQGACDRSGRKAEWARLGGPPGLSRTPVCAPAPLTPSQDPHPPAPGQLRGGGAGVGAPGRRAGSGRALRRPHYFGCRPAPRGLGSRRVAPHPGPGRLSVRSHGRPLGAPRPPGHHRVRVRQPEPPGRAALRRRPPAGRDPDPHPLPRLLRAAPGHGSQGGRQGGGVRAQAQRGQVPGVPGREPLHPGRGDREDCGQPAGGVRPAPAAPGPPRLRVPGVLPHLRPARRRGPLAGPRRPLPRRHPQPGGAPRGPAFGHRSQ